MYNRPKTSRGKAHPSPDEFFDYVVPSPIKRTPKMSEDDHSLLNSRNYHPQDPREFNRRSAGRTPHHPESISVECKLSNFELELDVNNEDKQIRILACWLFGSALKL